MPAINITERTLAIQYTGTNSAEIDGLITDFVISSEVGGVLTFTSQGNPYMANTGDWIRYTQGFVENVHTTANLNFIFIRNAVHDDLAAATAGLKTAGIKEVPAVALASTVNVDVTLTPALASTSGRTAQAQLFASAAVLATLSIGTPTFLSTSAVRVPVTTSGVLALSAARVLVTVT